MNRLQVKICGVTNVEDASACADLGADMIGLNFYPESARYIRPQHARKIIEVIPRDVRAVGVFVDPTASEVRSIAKSVDLEYVQLHGNVPPETCRELASEFCVIRAFSTDGQFKPEDVRSFLECDVILDAHHAELRGGTGLTCDWSLARATLPFARFLILSGGLNAQNIGQAIATVAPHAVDVCSGVETAPGVKDRRAIEKFIAAARAAEHLSVDPSR
ncbi:MAG TPA: phosphoribosylanthranilate isomerase [Candidatus Udaeobacter sp.]